MFEYLMPAIFMQGSSDSLLEKAYQGAVFEQKAYAKKSPKVLEILDESSKVFYSYILEKNPTIQEFIETFQEEFPDIVGAVVNYQFGEDDDHNKQCYDDCLWVIYRGHLAFRQSKLFEKLRSADADEKRVIMQELYEITQQINSRRVDL